MFLGDIWRLMMKIRDFIFKSDTRTDKEGETELDQKIGRNRKKYDEKSILRSINTQYILVHKRDKDGNVCEIVYKPIDGHKKTSRRNGLLSLKLSSFSRSVKK